MTPEPDIFREMIDSNDSKQNLKCSLIVTNLVCFSATVLSAKMAPSSLCTVCLKEFQTGRHGHQPAGLKLFEAYSSVYLVVPTPLTCQCQRWAIRRLHGIAGPHIANTGAHRLTLEVLA